MSEEIYEVVQRFIELSRSCAGRDYDDLIELYDTALYEEDTDACISEITKIMS